MIESRLEYKGYIADFRYDVEEQRIVGRVVNTTDRISFHANSIDEVVSSFKNAIDTYLELMGELGVKPSEIGVPIAV